MKAIARRIKVIPKIYWHIDPFLRALLIRISPALANRYLYWFVLGKNLDTQNPKSFNEKIIWLKANWKDSRLVSCTDKYLVRHYVEEKGCADSLNELLGVFEHADEIDWHSLPDQFVLKCTHGCGCNIVCTDKSKISEKETLATLDRWMKTDYSRLMAEMHYQKIKPRIVCEKYLSNNQNIFPTDYKLYCFDGVAALVLVCTERDTSLTLSFFDLDWNPLNIGSDGFPPDLNQKKPDSFSDMISIAEKLSKGVPFVRVDFYNFQDQPVFGEMTFTPAGGFAPYYSVEGDIKLGHMLTIPGS